MRGAVRAATMSQKRNQNQREIFLSDSTKHDAIAT